MAHLEIRRFDDCASDLERAWRPFVVGLNVLLLLGLTLATCGAALIAVLLFWLIAHLLAESNVRSVEALGVTVSAQQFPEVHGAAQEIGARMSWKVSPRIVVIHSGEANAFAVRFARRRVIVLYSELLEELIDHPAQLRFLLAHEMCHGALDHGPRGLLEFLKPGVYSQARELTCDNAGMVAAGSLPESVAALKKLHVGARLHFRLVDQALVGDAVRLYSGFSGAMLRWRLSHPPVGARLQNLHRFAVRCFGSAYPAGV